MQKLSNFLKIKKLEELEELKKKARLEELDEKRKHRQSILSGMKGLRKNSKNSNSINKTILSHRHSIHSIHTNRSGKSGSGKKVLLEHYEIYPKQVFLEEMHNSLQEFFKLKDSSNNSNWFLSNKNKDLNSKTKQSGIADNIMFFDELYNKVMNFKQGSGKQFKSFDYKKKSTFIPNFKSSDKTLRSLSTNNKAGIKDNKDSKKSLSKNIY